MTDETATALAQAAEELRAAAAVHKRSVAAHRRAGRNVMRALAVVQEAARNQGIDLNLKNTAQGGEVDRGTPHPS